MSEPDDNLSENTGEMGHTPPGGWSAMVMAGLALGILMLGLQLWLLTLALDLYLSGRTENTWQLVLISGLIFIGGFLLLRLLAKSRSTTT